MTEPFRLRRGTADDSRACWDLSWDAISDLAARQGNPWPGTSDDHWPRFNALFALLAEIAAEWWVAEDELTGRLIGFARSVLRGGDHGLFELAELLVRPGHQSAGVGRELLDRAFPPDRGSVRVILATTDVRAIARYLRAGTSIQFPVLGMTGSPRHDAADAIGLEVEPIGVATLEQASAIEHEVLGYARGDRELRWLLDDREGYLYRRDGDAAFAFVSAARTGPIAATDPSLLPDVLRHLESRAAFLGAEEVGFEVPAPNVMAIGHLLDRGFRIDPFYTFLMSSRPFGRFDRFIGLAPPLVL
jgi:GNAT superfamily N-acetyltransferase